MLSGLTDYRQFAADPAIVKIISYLEGLSLIGKKE